MKRNLVLMVCLATLGSAAWAQDATIFSKGQKAPATSFTGTVWLLVLNTPDSGFNYHIANVMFEPGARTYWHMHPGGQILLVTQGDGYYQEKGRPVQRIGKGDVIKCAPGVEHWHGASAQHALTHIGITNNGPSGIVVWRQEVTDEEYGRFR